MTRAAVLGSPIGHTLSPALHRAAYRELGLAWRYDAIECDEAGLAGFLASLDGEWGGLSLTMPLKKAVLPLLDEASDLVTTLGAANTVVFGDGRRGGHNTDVYGIVAALREAGVTGSGNAMILGGGATACSALAALRELGSQNATLAVRNPARAGEAREVATRLGLNVQVRTLDELRDLLGDAGLVVSTLPAGGADPYAAMVAASGATVFDVVYAPWPSPLAAAAEAAGSTVIGGFPMLLHQAARQVSLMTGYPDVPVEAMRAAAERELRRS